MKITLNQVGMGDVIIFLSFLSDFHKEDSIFYDFNFDTIKTYKGEFDEYYSFLIEFSKMLIKNTNHRNINFDNESTFLQSHNINIQDIISIYNSRNRKFRFIDLLKDDGNSKSESVVILTKVRGCAFRKYNEIKESFYDILNSSGKSIILLGEKEIEYGLEYSLDSLHTDHSIYSIYGDLITFLDQEKVIDLTVPKLGISSPDMKKLNYDLDIIKSNKVISFGHSGIVQLCSLFTEVVSYANTEYINNFLDQDQNILLQDGNKFLQKLKSIMG